MNENQAQLFQALTKAREIQLKESNFKSQIEFQKNFEHDLAKAHFIHELLKNADEAQATSAHFVLKPTHLLFRHNGKSGFSISDVNTESQDIAHKKIGSINSLTLPEHFQKSPSSIGKFGFRSVFAYTSTPKIYDPSFRFQIDNYIVPHWLENDHPNRKAQETLISLDFEDLSRFGLNASQEILAQLQSLFYSFLFFSHLTQLDYQWLGGNGFYQKEILSHSSLEGSSLRVEKLCLTHKIDDQVRNKNIFWVFHQTYEEKGKSYPCCVAFLADPNGNLKPLPHQPVFSFFPTQENTGLKFLIHAPFLLHENRKMIRWKESLNSKLINFLAEITAEAILYFKSLEILDDSILSVIPYDLQELSRLTGKDKMNFRSFYYVIRSTFKKQPILPSTHKEYGWTQNAYWAENSQLPQLFSNKKLRLLLHNNQAFWAFPSLGANLVKSKNPELARFIETLVKDTLTEKDLLKGRANLSRSIHENTSISGITSSFIETQSIEWLSSFYLWLAQSPSRWKAVRTKPIFLNDEGKAIAAFEGDRQNVFPYGGKWNFKTETIHPYLLKKVGTPCLLYRLNIRPHGFKEEFPSLEKLIQFFISQGYQKNKVDYSQEEDPISWLQEEKVNLEKKKKDDFFTPPYDEISNPYSSLPNKLLEGKDQKESPNEKGVFNFSKERILSSDLQRISPKNEEKILKPNVSSSNRSEERLDSKLGTLSKDFFLGKETKRISQRMDQFLDQFDSQEKAAQEAQKFPKYSFGWVTRLLAAEILSNRKNKKDKTKKQIESLWLRFDRVEREPNTKRTLILTQPKTRIPQSLKDFSLIPLTFHLKGTTKTIPIESAEIQEDCLRVKLQTIQDIQGLDLNDVKYVEMENKPATFLTKALLQEMLNFKYADTFDFQKNLCENIQFIFGPPGTGKTTHLAQKVLTPLMQQEESKVLVLTPTNKAADVLTRKIMEMDQNCEDWLIRFGATEDEKIENSSIFKGKSFDIQSVSKNVTITTLARLSYDKFYPSTSEEILLSEVDWDYIVVDEASMVSLASMVYLLYKMSPKKFIVAGDPFQIEPILKERAWKNETIYTMVHLNSFADPQTIPYQYDVISLHRQYRSIPEIGQLFSRFAYEGKLENDRSSTSQKALHLKDNLTVSPLNLIKFPVRSYDGLYKLRKLKKSPYQIYSALFAFEFVSYLAKEIAKAHCEEHFKLGVIGPYAAQMNLIDKLVATQKWPPQVEVQVGTIHSFQGDECDIVLAVLNLPPYLNRLDQAHTDNKNILNVSISRARDYLFVLMPNDETENLENFEQLTLLKHLLQESEILQEWSTQELEEKIFKDKKYLESNTFFTSHQDVNVYSWPERRYEVRVEYNAIDIQVHRMNQRSIKIRKPDGLSKRIKEFHPNPLYTSFDREPLQELKEDLQEIQQSSKEEKIEKEAFKESILEEKPFYKKEENQLLEPIPGLEELILVLESLKEEKEKTKEEPVFSLDEETKEELAFSLLEKIKEIKESPLREPDFFESISHQKLSVLKNLIARPVTREREDFFKESEQEEIFPILEKDLEDQKEIPIQDFSKVIEKEMTIFPLEKDRKEPLLELKSSLSNNFTNNKELSWSDEPNSGEALESLVESQSGKEPTALQAWQDVEEPKSIVTEFGEMMNIMETIFLEEQPSLVQEIVTHQERMQLLLMAQKEELINLKKKLMATQTQSISQEKESVPETSLSSSFQEAPFTPVPEPSIMEEMEFSSPMEEEKVILNQDPFPLFKEERSSINQTKFLMDHPLIPETWVQEAKKVKVTGQNFGDYVLIPYTGKVEIYTHQKPQSLYMVLSGFKKKISLPVYVVEDLIFVSRDAFMSHKNELQQTLSVELKKKGIFATLFGKFKG